MTLDWLRHSLMPRNSLVLLKSDCKEDDPSSHLRITGCNLSLTCSHLGGTEVILLLGLSASV